MRKGNLLVANSVFQKCLKTSLGSDDEVVTFCLEQLADRQQWGMGDVTWTTIFLMHVLKTKQKLPIHKALVFLADTCSALDDTETATSLLTLALKGFTDMDVHLGRAECMHRLGELSMQQKDFSAALEFWKEARPLFERSSQMEQVVLVDAKITTISERLSTAHKEKLGCLSELHLPSSVVEATAVQTED